MQTTKHPYELLIRWDQQGQLAGAHVQYRYVIKDSDQIIGESVGQAEPLTIGDFPLTDLLNQVQADALAKIEQLKFEVERLRVERDVPASAVNASTAE
jgi:hypothetical protein